MRGPSQKIYSTQLHTPPHEVMSYCLVRYEGEAYHIAAQYERALCGEDVTGGVRCEIPVDFGKDSDDCRSCARVWDRIEKKKVASHA